MPDVDLERIDRALGEYASVLEDIARQLSELRAELKVSPQQAPPAGNTKPKSRGRSKYTFNRAILAVLHKHGCMSQGEVMRTLKLGKDETAAFQDAWEYLTAKGLVVPDSAKRCWTVRG